MMKYWIVSVCFFLSFHPSSAKSPYIDSLQLVVRSSDQSAVNKITAYTSLGWTYRRINLDSGFLFLAKAWELLEPMPYDSLHFEHDYTKGTLLRYRGHYEKSIQVLEQGIAHAKSINRADQVARTHYALSIACNEAHQYDEAIQHAQEARQHYAKHGPVERELGSLNVLATILKDIERFDDAEQIYLEAYQVAKEREIYYQLEPICNNLASVYVRTNRPEKALPYYKEALAINERAKDLHGISTLKGNIARIQLGTGDYEGARKNLEHAIEIKESLGAEEDLVGFRGAMGALKVYLGDTQAGLAQMEASLKEAQEKGYRTEEEGILHLMVTSTKETKLYQKAADYYAQYTHYQEDHFADILASKVNELNAKYQKAEQDQKIGFLSTENELQKVRLNQQRLFLWGGGAVLLIVSLLSFAIYRLYIKVKDQNRVIAQSLDDKEVLLKEIHHRVKNNLQVVSSLLNLQSYKIKDQTALQAIREGRTRVHSMSLIHQALYRKDNLTGVNLHEYLDQLCKSLFETYQVRHDQVKLHTEIEPLMLDVDSVVPLGLIINELLTNALKYAFPDSDQGIINIRVHEGNQGLHLMVQDNGIGIENADQIQDNDSFGFELINAFKHKLDADLSIQNQGGTLVQMVIKKYLKAA